jgi:hypothetical protein
LPVALVASEKAGVSNAVRPVVCPVAIAMMAMASVDAMRLKMEMMMIRIIF